MVENDVLPRKKDRISNNRPQIRAQAHTHKYGGIKTEDLLVHSLIHSATFYAHVFMMVRTFSLVFLPSSDYTY